MTRLQSFFYKIFYFFFMLPFEGAKPVFSQILDWAAAMYAEFTLIVMRRIETDFAPKLKPMIEKAERTGKVPPEVQPLLDEMKNPSAPIGALLGNAVGGGATGGIVSSTLGPWLLLLQYEMQRLANQARWDPSTGLAVVYRRPDKEELVNSDLRDQGWTAERISLLKDVARTRLVEDLCVDLRRRGIYTEAQYLESMRWLGYEAKEAQDYYTAKESWPGVSDLVRMAVREAFTPEIAEKFGQYQDLPQEFIDRAKKIGLPEEYARAFWAAHWELPSAQMGFDMLHRGIITQDELKTLLRALDVMPFWRDKLINLAYTPFTRVDIRRMHALGILTQAQVLQAYKDIGYNDEKARALTDFTIKLNSGTASSAQKDLTQSQIVSAYKQRLISQDEATAALRDLGYDDSSIFLLLSMGQQQATAATRDLTLSQVKSLYQKGLRTRLECTGWLTAFGYDAGEITALYDLWDWEKPAADKLPSRTDYDNYLSAGIIDMTQWSDGYTALGYDMTFQEWQFSYLVTKGKVSEG